LDAFTKVVWLSVLICIVAFAFVGYVTLDAIQGSKIPDEQYGLVTAKGPVTDNHPANYTVTLDNSKTFYITSNTTAYEVLEVNKTFLLACRLDINNGMSIVDSAWQTNRTDT
jgi:hypothetical protein